MSRTVWERMKTGEWWLEQAAHWFVGDVIGQVVGWITFAAGGAPIVCGALAVSISTMFGILREIVQNVGDDDNSIGDATFDVLFWSLGGLRSAYPFWVLG